MKKMLLWTVLASIVVVNALSWLVAQFSDIFIAPMFRMALIAGICFITLIFVGAAALLGFLETEDPESQWNNPDE